MQVPVLFLLSFCQSFSSLGKAGFLKGAGETLHIPNNQPVKECIPGGSNWSRCNEANDACFRVTRQLVQLPDSEASQAPAVVRRQSWNCGDHPVRVLLMAGLNLSVQKRNTVSTTTKQEIA